MKTDIQDGGQAVGAKGFGEQVVVGQQDFAVGEFGAGEERTAIIDQVEHGKRPAGTSEKSVRRSLPLPEFSDAPALPTTRRYRRGSHPAWMGQSVLNGPAPHLSTIQFKLVFTEHLTGCKAVGGRRTAAQAF